MTGAPVHLCGPFLSVPGKTECREAVWSQGRSCYKCPLEACYRRGWDAARVTVDNRRLVAAKNREARS